jgi:hypothetical protein
MIFRYARTHAKFSSSRVRRKKLCINESAINLKLLINRKKIAKMEIKKLILIFDEKMESVGRYMAIVTCDLIKFGFNF